VCLHPRVYTSSMARSERSGHSTLALMPFLENSENSTGCVALVETQYCVILLLPQRACSVLEESARVKSPRVRYEW